jgi:ABC-type transport system substrate-binding protein
MTIRRFLIFAPILLIIVLLQSYFWVPTYEEQTKGNPERLNEYITGSIGDASLLNPILTADSASSSIENMVFEGLIDRDEQLRFRGRLATSWEISEEAFFYVNKSAVIPGRGKLDAQDVANFLKNAKKKKDAIPPGLKNSLDYITSISVIPPRNYSVTKELKDPHTGEQKKYITINISAPARIKFVLNRVDPDFFQNLLQLLGKNYFESFNGKSCLMSDSQLEKEKIAEYAGELLPAVEHNPVLLFHLRPGVRFHDGHLFDAHDVKFTYESIMNPKNLSPRIADYEPVKSVTVVDPLTVKIVYKRLYSPAMGTWGMGILPEHLLNQNALKKEAQHLGKTQIRFPCGRVLLTGIPSGADRSGFRNGNRISTLSWIVLTGTGRDRPTIKNMSFESSRIG